jgi:hypothetical protein
MDPRMKTPQIALALLSLAFTACAARQVNYVSADEFIDPKFGALGLAAYEMKCPESKLEVVDLTPNTVGVSGCEKQNIYVWVSGPGWVNNTAGSGSAKQ